MEFLESALSGQFLGKPAWMWLAFVGIVTVLLVLDLGVLHKEQREIPVGESLVLSTVYIGLGLTFASTSLTHSFLLASWPSPT